MRHWIVDHNRREFLRLAASGVAALALAASPLGAFAQTASGAPLKIGTIGGGKIAGAIGALWVKAGHPVMFSSRHPEELKGLVDGLGPLARAGTPAEAVAFGDIVLLAVPYGAMKQVGQDNGPALATKALVLDASNPIVPRDGELGAWAREKGAGLATAELLPGAHIVRGFNAINYLKLPADAHPSGGERVGMPIAGDDPKAIALASTLIREIGLEPVVIGGLAMGKYLIPGTPLGGEHTPEQIRQIVASLK